MSHGIQDDFLCEKLPSVEITFQGHLDTTKKGTVIVTIKGKGLKSPLAYITSTPFYLGQLTPPPLPSGYPMFSASIILNSGPLWAERKWHKSKDPPDLGLY